MSTTAIELRDVFRVHSTPEGDAAASSFETLAAQAPQDEEPCRISLAARDTRFHRAATAPEPATAATAPEPATAATAPTTG